MATASSLKGEGRLNAFDAIAAAQTDSNLVSAMAGAKLRVVALFVNNTDVGAGTVTFNSKGSGAGTAIAGPFDSTQNGGFVLPLCESGWFESLEGEGLTITTAAASAASVVVVYEIIKLAK